MNRKAFAFLFILGIAFSASITGVRIQPNYSFYNTGQKVKIVWSYTGIANPATQKVKITLWRQGGTENICLIADNVALTARQYEWEVPERCANPHTGAMEDLTAMDQLKVRVRWKGNPVWGESGLFKVRKLRITGVYLRPRSSVYTVGQLISIRWADGGFPAGEKVRVMIWEKGASTNICKINEENVVLHNIHVIGWRVSSTCINPHTGAREDLRGRNLRIRVGWVYPPGYRGRAVYDEGPEFTITTQQELQEGLEKLQGKFTQLPPKVDPEMVWGMWFNHNKTRIKTAFEAVGNVRVFYDKFFPYVRFIAFYFGSLGISKNLILTLENLKLPEPVLIEGYLAGSPQILLGRYIIIPFPERGFKIKVDYEEGATIPTMAFETLKNRPCLMVMKRKKDGSVLFSRRVMVEFVKYSKPIVIKH